MSTLILYSPNCRKCCNGGDPEASKYLIELGRTYESGVMHCVAFTDTFHSCYKREVDLIQKKLAAGTQKDCFAVEFLKQCEKDESLDETQRLFALGSLMEAGSDTSKVSLGQIIAAACVYPDWVQRARKELDAVCGSDAERFPEFSDRDQLPYITAVVKEGFRWRPNIAEIGAPTVLIKDDDYEGYKFPAGTVFTWNAWAIALDPREYEDPERFWPERFLNDDLRNPLKGHWAFGPGECETRNALVRSCPVC